MSSDDQIDQNKKVLELVREAVKHDEALRKKYEIGNKFRFIPDRLHKLLERMEEALKVQEPEKTIDTKEATSDEVLIYVYLYNAHGILLRNWQNMVTPKVFYEYSVNRPIYLEKKYVETLIRSKVHKYHHAFLTVAINRKDVFQTENLKDPLGNPLVRVREGSLRFNRLISLTHNDNAYEVDSEGELIKKTES